ncbi:MAG: hypothetical protein M5U34_20970 [Chloroflexi bacterium]|nr:hypothetical protein [Chloroflexota bacterium]
MTLTQTAVYRRGERSWLLAPPLSDFWGEWVINKGERLTLIYPQRDAAIAERLAVDLEEVVAQICEQPGFPPCTDSLKIALRLDTSPASLAQGVDRRSLFDKQAYLNLPAPTLFGLPQNEAGYEALLRAYLRSSVATPFMPSCLPGNAVIRPPSFKPWSITS